jgi:hypothetical protein
MSAVKNVLKRVQYYFVYKGKKTMKTVISFPPTSFQAYNESVNENDEIVVSGLDGNGQAFSQTVPTQGNAGVLAYNPTSKNFDFFASLTDMTDDYQVHKIIRAVA